MHVTHTHTHTHTLKCRHVCNKLKVNVLTSVEVHIKILNLYIVTECIILYM